MIDKYEKIDSGVTASISRINDNIGNISSISSISSNNTNTNSNKLSIKKSSNADMTTNLTSTNTNSNDKSTVDISNVSNLSNVSKTSPNNNYAIQSSLLSNRLIDPPLELLSGSHSNNNQNNALKNGQINDLYDLDVDMENDKNFQSQNLNSDFYPQNNFNCDIMNMDQHVNGDDGIYGGGSFMWNFEDYFTI